MSTLDDPRDLHGAPAAKPARASTTGWPRLLGRGLRRLVLLTMMGLVLAGIVHILAVLLIPVLAERDAASVYAALGDEGHAELVTPAPAGLPGLAEPDPNSVSAVCSFDLSTGPVRVSAQTGALPLGLTLHRRGGGVAYAITDRAAIRGVLEFVVMTQEQRDERRLHERGLVCCVIAFSSGEPVATSLENGLYLKVRDGFTDQIDPI